MDLAFVNVSTATNDDASAKAKPGQHIIIDIPPPVAAFPQPQDIPLNYYARLVEGHSIPVFISEGGWSSQTVTNFTGTPQKQQDYIGRQAQLLGQVNTIAYFQLLFSDLNVASLPAGVPDNVNLFAYIGLTDTILQPKHALKNWDTLFNQKLVAGH